MDIGRLELSMEARRFNNGWIAVSLALALIIVAGGIFIWTRYHGEQPLEITAEPPREITGGVYISGEVHAPGYYPLEAGDGIDGLLRAAGGTTGSAVTVRIELHIPGTEDALHSQRIDINTAGSWLLEALPGVGETRARAIIDYRTENGPFHTTGELLLVDGFGETSYERIRHLITVGE